MRIDRLLCEMNMGTRSQVKELIKRGQVMADGAVIKKPETQVDEGLVRITCNGKEYRYRPFVYYMMNKPAGVITATFDKKEKTVLDLMKEKLSLLNGEELAGIPFKSLFPVGRLDRDTVGLLLITNDGALAHRLLSPGRHVPKKYFVRTDRPVDGEMVKRLEDGVTIGSGERTRPARVALSGENEGVVTVTEGKYHQVKRMFQAVGVKVTYLKRLSMGGLTLDEGLGEGEIRELTQKEVMDLCSGI